MSVSEQFIKRSQSDFADLPPGVGFGPKDEPLRHDINLLGRILGPIRLRNPYVDLPSYIQVSLLRRVRSLPAHSPEREATTHPLLLTIAGISSGLLNTG